jgi:alpha-tubulin suppressor-like RCC1 family protein
MIVTAVLAIALAPQVKQVAGADFVAILTTDGSVYGIGRDPYGMHLRPDWKDSVVATPLKMTLPGPVVQIATGERTCYALMKDGTVFAWGQNDSGQLGDGKPYGGFKPRLSAEPVAGLTDIVQISAHSKHAIALRKDGKVFAWGQGVLPPGKLDDNSTPKMVDQLSDVKKVDTGSGHTLALTKDGSVYAWGSNNNAQVGTGKYSEPVYTPTKVANLPKAIDISAGMNESGAVSYDGKVYVWGLNTSGLLGNGQRPGAPIATGGIVMTPTAVQGISGVQNISFDYGSQIALHTNGTLTVWGFDGWGQHGIGESGGYTLKPKKPSISGVASINAIGNRTFLIKRDGSLWWAGVKSGAKNGPMKSGVKVFTKLTLE